MTDNPKHITHSNRYLIKIARKSQGYRWMHSQDAQYYHQLSERVDKLEILTLTMAGLLTSTEWASLVSDKGLQNYPSFTVSIASVQLLLLFILGIITGIKHTQQFTQLADQHKRSAIRYARIALEIQSYIVKHKPYDETFIDSITEMYNTAFEDSPDIREESKQRWYKGGLEQLDEESRGAFNLMPTADSESESPVSTSHQTSDSETDPAVSQEAYRYQIDRWLSAF